MIDRMTGEESSTENSIELLTDALVKGIEHSSEFARYHSLRRKLVHDQALMDRVNEYRRKCFYLQAKEYDDGDSAALKSLSREYSDILSVGVVDEFLIAEQRLCNIIKSVMESITLSSGIDLEL